MNAQPYGLHTTVDADFATTRGRVTAALAAEGFGILTEIDVSATFKKKLDVDFRPYTILGACNPHLAHQAISAEADIGLLLPCNVVLQAVEGGTRVSIADPRAMFSVVPRDDMDALVQEATARLERVLAALG
ncbi:MAG: DUF302 domain-containing protein [Myxococcales bacterium]|nr:DUF302 domain-containing protein [Myxococcales bacterium]